MIASAHLDRFARDNLPPREQWPDFRFSLPELNYPDRMNCAVELLDRWIESGPWRPSMPDLADESLTYAQLAERVNRIANALTRELGLVPGNRVLLRGPNSPMMVAAYFAVIKAGGVVVATMPLAARKGDRLSAEQGEDRARALRCPSRRRDGEGAGSRARSQTHRLLGERARDDLEALMASPGYETFHRLRHRQRRCLPHCVYLRDNRRAQGHHAFSPRHARDLRQLRAPRAARRTFRPVHRLAADRLHLRARRACAVSRFASALRAFSWKGRHRTISWPASRSLERPIVFTAPTAYRAMLGKLAAAQYLDLAQMRLGGRSLAEGDVRCLARGDRHQDPGRDRRDRDAAHLHRLAGKRNSPGIHRQASAGL